MLPPEIQEKLKEHKGKQRIHAGASPGLGRALVSQMHKKGADETH